MSEIEIITSIGVVGTLLAVLVSLQVSRSQQRADRKMKALEYISAQLDDSDVLQARAFLNQKYSDISDGSFKLADAFETFGYKNEENYVREYLIKNA